MIQEHIVNENVYEPYLEKTYPDSHRSYMLSPVKVREVQIDAEYPFLDLSFKAKCLHVFIYAGIFLLVFWLNPLRYGLKIEGRKGLKKYKKQFKNGAMTVANHVYRWDFLAILQAVRFRCMWFPARQENLETSDAWMIRGAGGIPVPDTSQAMKKFNAAFNYLHKKKKWLHCFPEASRWDFYGPIRPFRKGAFSMAYSYNLPVIPMAFSYRKPTGLYKFFKVKHPLITLRIGEPIFPDKTIGKSESCDKMRKEAHEQICALAGIKQNGWPAILD